MFLIKYIIWQLKGYPLFKTKVFNNTELLIEKDTEVLGFKNKRLVEHTTALAIP